MILDFEILIREVLLYDHIYDNNIFYFIYDIYDNNIFYFVKLLQITNL